MQALKRNLKVLRFERKVQRNNGGTLGLPMTEQDIQILLKYLVKATVIPTEHDEFIRAVERLESLLRKAQRVA